MQQQLAIAITPTITKKCNTFRTSSKSLLNRAQNQGSIVVVLKERFLNNLYAILRYFESSMIHPLHS